MVNSKWILISLLFSQINHAAPENINTANAQEMAEALYGVGQYKAEAIVQYRSINGPFKAVGEIKRIQRIGQTIIIGNGDDIKVN